MKNSEHTCSRHCKFRGVLSVKCKVGGGEAGDEAGQRSTESAVHSVSVS